MIVAGDVTVAALFGAAGALLVAIVTGIVALIIEAVAGGDAVDDVERFIELAEAGRYSRLPYGPLLSDPDGDASAAIDDLLAKKQRARKALWSSRDANRLKRAAATESGRPSKAPMARETKMQRRARDGERAESISAGPLQPAEGRETG